MHSNAPAVTPRTSSGCTTALRSRAASARTVSRPISSTPKTPFTAAWIRAPPRSGTASRRTLTKDSVRRGSSSHPRCSCWADKSCRLSCSRPRHRPALPPVAPRRVAASVRSSRSNGPPSSALSGNVLPSGKGPRILPSTRHETPALRRYPRSHGSDRRADGKPERFRAHRPRCQDAELPLSKSEGHRDDGRR